ncbi:MAG TPA: protein phosphatase 2C domain-containing protein, partial [Ilumatobacteraceae bacterium]
MTTTAGRWAAVTASVRGASHERNGKPNQDAVRVVQAKGSTPGLVAAVCDGHGGDRYVRSDVGSRL